jgi:hypothetical protein
LGVHIVEVVKAKLFKSVGSFLVVDIEQYATKVENDILDLVHNFLKSFRQIYHSRQVFGFSRSYMYQFSRLCDRISGERTSKNKDMYASPINKWN